MFMSLLLLKICGVVILRAAVEIEAPIPHQAAAVARFE
jgi:hypothetical protein